MIFKPIPHRSASMFRNYCLDLQNDENARERQCVPLATTIIANLFHYRDKFEIDFSQSDTYIINYKVTKHCIRNTVLMEAKMEYVSYVSMLGSKGLGYG